MSAKGQYRRAAELQAPDAESWQLLGETTELPV
jgi:hypothetical protein